MWAVGFFFVVAISQQLQVMNLDETNRTVVVVGRGSFRVSSYINSTHMDVAFSVSASGWAATGVKNSASSTEMGNADIIMFREESGNFVCEDRWSTGNDAPRLDSEIGGASDILAWFVEILSFLVFPDRMQGRPTGQRRFLLPLCAPS